MDVQALEAGRRYFCREETTGKQHGGMFHVDDQELVAELFAFDQYLGGDFDNLLIVRLENNSIASLHNNIAHGPARSYDITNARETCSWRVVSNAVVVGESAWEGDAPIHRVHFAIDHAEELLRHSDRYDAMADAEIGGEMPDPLLFELRVHDLTVRVRYTASGNLSAKRPTRVGIRYELEFDTPRDLKTYLADMGVLVQFVSAALGFRFSPSDIRISSLTSAAYLEAVKARKGYKAHRLHYIWPVEAPKRSLWVGRAPVHARDDAELAALIACLQEWIERDPAWRGATTLMMGALALQDTLSGERLLNACSWLEEIPGADSEIIASEEDIAAIADAAAAVAEKRGLADYRTRVAGVIRGQLKKESNAERFARLQGALRERFGSEAPGDDIVPHLLKAMQFRGQAAHGHFEPVNDADFQAFSKAIYAMEALCYLLTIKDLPMPDDGVIRATRQHIVTNYLRYPG